MKTSPDFAPTATTLAAIVDCCRPNLTVLERDFIERRLSEEETALNLIVCHTFPLVVTFPDMRTPEWLRPVGRGSTSPEPT